MIRYDLRCAKGHEFDSWFRDSSAFDTQVSDGHLSCPQCGSPKVEKALMTPGLPVKANAAKITLSGPEAEAGMSLQNLSERDKHALAFQHVVREMRRQVEANSDYVGDRFAEEARRLYYAEVDHQASDEAPADVSAKALNEHGKGPERTSPDASTEVPAGGLPGAGQDKKTVTKSKKPRGIYGEATLEDAKALHEEGIDVMLLPGLPEDKN